MLTPPQELYRLGILYDNQLEETSQDSIISCQVPLQQESPLYTLRHRKPKRAHASRRRPTWRSLPVRLSLSNLGGDVDIASFFSQASTTNTTTKKTPPIQHRPNTRSKSISLNIPRSLPQATAGAPALSPSPQTPPPPIYEENADWEFINIHKSTSTTTQPNSPFSEPETWILLGDDSKQ